MSSQFERTFQALAVPSLVGEHGEELTHRPRGVVAEAETIVGICVEEPPQRDTAAGAENVRMMRVNVAASVSVSKDSQWVIRSEDWLTLKIGKVFAGRRDVWVTRRGAGIRTKAREPI